MSKSVLGVESGAEKVLVKKAGGGGSGEGASGQGALEQGVGCPLDGLPPEKQAAIEHLAGGSSVSAAAKLAGVGRTTLHRWLREDAVFIAAFNAWRNEVRSTARDRLLAGLSEAVDTVREAIRAGDSRLAFNLLKTMKVTEPEDSTAEADEDVETVKKQLKVKGLEREKELDVKEDMAIFGFTLPGLTGKG